MNKNKYQKALDSLINISLSDYTDVEEVAKHQATLNVLVDRSCGKHVIRYKEQKLYDSILCPNCCTKLNVVMKGQEMKAEGNKYCKHCGQMLIYEDERNN